MENFQCELFDVPRKFRFPAKLYACGYFMNAVGGGCGRRDNTLEYGIRLASGEPYATEMINGTEYNNKIPHVIVKAPEMVHYSTINTPREICYIIYTKESIPFLHETGLPTNFSYLTLKNPEIIREYMEKISEFVPDRFIKGVADKLDLLAFQILEEIYLTEENAGEAEQFYDQKILDIATKLRTGLRDEITVEKLLKIHGLSRRTFFRYWHKHFSISPRTYLLELRFQEAKELLIKTTLPVATIAEQLHYPSSSYFCEHFKRRFGKTPLRARQEAKYSEFHPDVS